MSSNSQNSRRSHKRKRSHCRLPARWKEYDAIGRVILGTRFLPFKTPLRHEYFENRNDCIEWEQVFEVETLVKHVADQGKQLGLVIDLTATDRYYDPREYKKYNIEYVKLRCPGHFADKDENTARNFMDIVSRFLSRNPYNGKLIGVHCTHGLNRTGFLICKYMIEVDGLRPKDAIQRFENGRGYKIERMRYVNALQDCSRG